MTAQFQQTVDDHVEFNEGPYKPCKSVSRWQRLKDPRWTPRGQLVAMVGVFCLALGAGLLIVAGISLAIYGDKDAIAPLILGGLLFVFCLTLFLPFARRRRVKKQFLSDTRNAALVTCCADDHSFRYEVAGVLNQMEWGSFVYFGETDQLLVLSDAKIAYMVPKRAFANPADEQAFRNLVPAALKLP